MSSLLESFDSLSRHHRLNAFLIKEDGDSLEVGLLKDFKEISSSKVKIFFVKFDIFSYSFIT